MSVRLSVEHLGGGTCSFVARAAPARLPTLASSAAVALIATGLAGGLTPVRTVAALMALLLSWLLGRRFIVREESLTAIEGIGLQLSTRCASGRETAQFIDVSSISAIFLAEAVRCDRCYFYLACLLHGEERADGKDVQPRLVVPFHHLLPPLHDLHRVYHGVWAVLWRCAPGNATHMGLGSGLSRAVRT